MKHKILLTIFALTICATGARAELCTITTTDSPLAGIPYQSRDYIQNCTAISYKNFIYYSSTIFSVPVCTACKRTYSLITVSNAEIDWTGSCTSNNQDDLALTICAKPCNSSCVSDDYYNSDSNGVESMVIRKCDNYMANKTCQISYDYRCESGYYGEATSGSTGCTKCPYPHNDEHYMADSAPGEALSITDCYISKNSYFNYFRDSTGSYKCTEDAYYKE